MNNILEILLQAKNSSIGEDNCLFASDETLDLIWKHTLETTDNKSLLMSDVINGDEELDGLQIAFATEGTIEIADNLRNRLHLLFRARAFYLAEICEAEVRDAVLFTEPSEY